MAIKGPSLLKAKKKPIMRAERAKKPSLTMSSGIPSIPAVRPTSMRNLPTPSGVKTGKYI